MSILVKTIKAIPINFGKDIPKDEGPRAFRVDFDFTVPPASGSYQQTFDGASFGLKDVQTLFVDNGNNNSTTTITIVGSNQKVGFPPYSQGFIPVLVAGGSIALNVATAGTVNIPIQFMNVQHDGFIWSVQGNILQGTATVQGTVTAASPAVTMTSKAAAIVTGGTAVQIVPANGTRKGIFIQNPTDENGQNIGAREPCYISFGAAGGVNDGISIELQPGAPFSMNAGGVPTQAIWFNAATALHRVIAYELT